MHKTHWRVALPNTTAKKLLDIQLTCTQLKDRKEHSHRREELWPRISLANSWLAWYREVNLVTRFPSTSFPTATESDAAAYRRLNLYILCPLLFHLFMLPGNIQSRPISLQFNGITLSLYDEAQVALRNRRIEKNRLHSLRDIQECINRKQYWHFWQFTHYLPHIHNPTELGAMNRKGTLD